MSKAAKQSILILMVLLIGSFVFVGRVLFEKQKGEEKRIALLKDMEAYEARERKYLEDNKSMSERVTQAEEEKAKIAEELKNFDATIQGLNDQIGSLTKERDDWKGQVETLQKERTDLLAKLEEKPETKIVYKYVEPEPKAENDPKPEISLDGLGDSYWAGVLKEKAALELQVGRLTSELSSTAMNLEELKKRNTDLELELGKAKNDRETIEREIKHGKDLADTLSLDLARAKGDKKFMQDQLEKFKKDNQDLQSQLRELVSTKVALEKSIIRLTEEKKTVEKKLNETESVIQGKIEEIWRVKESLDKEFQPKVKTSSRSIELPPIIVSANDPWVEENMGKDEGAGFNGNIVSINEQNNFVIIDLGEKSGVRVGDVLGVYRDAEYVAEVEVIQIRPDICAADIKQKASDIKVGDVVR
ncbi:MAG: hypothetical protein WC552_03380 [Candidatus Omnitrophota bacterium]